jgi:hypothetical protein
MKLDINMLVRQMAAERDIEAETLVDAVAEAISSAARKHYKERNVHTDIDVETGEVQAQSTRHFGVGANRRTIGSPGPVSAGSRSGTGGRFQELLRSSR